MPISVDTTTPEALGLSATLPPDVIASAADAAVHRFVTGAYCVIEVDAVTGVRSQCTG